MPLEILLENQSPSSLEVDVLVVGLFEVAKDKQKSLGGALRGFDPAWVSAVEALMVREEFLGKKDQSLAVHTLGKLGAKRFVLLGLGEKKSQSSVTARAFAGRALRAATADKAKTLALCLPDGFEKKLRFVAEGLELGAYRFVKYLTGDRRPKAELNKVTLLSAARPSAEGKKMVALGQAVARGVNLTRDLSNEPGNAIYPETLAHAAQAMCKEHKLRCVVFDHKEILKRGMKLIDAVGRGSRREPYFVHMTYTPSKKAKKRYVFVGKGITFDSGGLSIKPAPGMGEMKHDMSGAANMVGLMAAVAAVAPQVEVHAIFAAAENMPDGNAYRPGDIWGSLDGKTVEMVNTDAEGRLILADALAYARKLEPDLLVDNATLTGACVVALGNTCTGYYATNDGTAKLFEGAAKEAGETMWRMPLLDDLRDQIKSEVADVKQAGDRNGGSITAALFLREFIGDTKNWVHADIAGPVTTERPSGWTQCKGATGHGVLTFLSLIERAS